MENRQKSERSTIEKTIKKLNSKLTKTQSDVQHARMVVQKVGNSNSKRIEDIVVKEFPQRYVSCGLRNWALLNADVVLLAEKMKGSLPTRENVLPLLSDIVRKQDTGKFFDTAAPRPRADCGSRVLPQKRILEEEFAIRYPTVNKRPRELFPSGSSSTVGSTQEVDDFKLAVELQYAENQAENMTYVSH